MVYAARGVGRTHLALEVAYAVASAGSFLGWQAQKSAGVLLLDGEMPGNVLQECLANVVKSQAAVAEKPFNILTPGMQKYGMPDLSTPKGQQAIEAHLEGVDLIVVDNISTLCRSGRENESEGWIPIQEWALNMRCLFKSN